MPNHVLGHIDRDELVAVVHRKGEPNHFRQDVGATRPGFDDLPLPGFLRLLDLSHQVIIDKGTFFNGTTHGELLRYLFRLLTMSRSEAFRFLVL